MTYKITVKGYNSGLNELLHAQKSRYDSRTKKIVVSNSEKSKNDKLCRNAILQAHMRQVRLDKPIQISYSFYVPNKLHDRSNTMSAFIKSFEDALQELKIIKNDTYDLVLTPKIYFEVDRENPRVEVEIEEID